MTYRELLLRWVPERNQGRICNTVHFVICVPTRSSVPACLVQTWCSMFLDDGIRTADAPLKLTLGDQQQVIALQEPEAANDTVGLPRNIIVHSSAAQGIVRPSKRMRICALPTCTAKLSTLAVA